MFCSRRTIARGFDDYRAGGARFGRAADVDRPGRAALAAARQSARLQISVFDDTSPRGFGLVQRRRDSPTTRTWRRITKAARACGSEPIGDWGEGVGHAGRNPERARRSTTTSSRSGGRRTSWRRRASTSSPIACTGAGTIRGRRSWPGSSQTRCGAGGERKTRQFVIDFDGRQAEGAARRREAARSMSAPTRARSPTSCVQRNPELQRLAPELRACAGRRRTSSSCAPSCWATAGR